MMGQPSSQRRADARHGCAGAARTRRRGRSLPSLLSREDALGASNGGAEDELGHRHLQRGCGPLEEFQAFGGQPELEPPRSPRLGGQRGPAPPTRGFCIHARSILEPYVHKSIDSRGGRTRLYVRTSIGVFVGGVEMDTRAINQEAWALLQAGRVRDERVAVCESPSTAHSTSPLFDCCERRAVERE